MFSPLPYPIHVPLAFEVPIALVWDLVTIPYVTDGRLKKGIIVFCQNGMTIKWYGNNPMRVTFISAILDRKELRIILSCFFTVFDNSNFMTHGFGGSNWKQAKA